MAASHSPSRRSIRRAPTRKAHQWQHPTSKPAIPHLDARLHKRPLETHISGMTAHQNQLSPSRRSIPRGTVRSFTNKSDSLKAVPACGRSSMRISTQRCEIKRLQDVFAVAVCMGLAILFRNAIRSKRLSIRQSDAAQTSMQDVVKIVDCDSPCKRSISQAPAQETHQWPRSKSKPTIAHVDALFCLQ